MDRLQTTRMDPIVEYTINVDQTTVYFFISGYETPEDESENQQAFLYQMHTHAFAELFCCIDGCTRINIDHTITELHPGEFLLIPAHIPHICVSQPHETVFSAIGIKLSQSKRKQPPSKIRNLLSPFLGSHHPFILKHQTDFAGEWISLIQSVNLYDKTVASLHLLSRFMLIITQGFEVLSCNPCVEEYHSEQHINLIASIEHIIDSQFMTAIDRQKIAEQLFISTRQLDRICQKRYDMTFRERVIHCRIISAAQILLDTDQTAEVIAHSVGFASKTSFYKEFQKKYGITPLQYRHMYKS